MVYLYVIWAACVVCMYVCVQGAAIDRKDVNRIEYMIRRTKKQLELLQMPTVDGLTLFSTKS